MTKIQKPPSEILTAVLGGMCLFVPECLSLISSFSVKNQHFQVHQYFFLLMKLLLVFILFSIIIGMLEWIFFLVINKTNEYLCSRFSLSEKDIIKSALVAVFFFFVWIQFFSIKLFSGTRISRTIYAWHGPRILMVLLFLFVFCLFYLGIKLNRKLSDIENNNVKSLRIIMFSALIAISSIFYFIDMNLYRGSYSYIHDLLFSIVFFGLQASSYLILNTQNRSEAGLRKNSQEINMIALLAAFFAFFLFFFRFSNEERSVIYRNAERYSSRILAIFDLLDLDCDGYSFLSGKDADDLNQTIHPFANDFPDNSIDEDQMYGDLSRTTLKKYKRFLEDAGKIDVFSADRIRKLQLKTQKLNIILLTVDSLRFDEARNSGICRNINRLFAESMFFESCYSNASCTYDSVPILLTSLYDWKQWQKCRNLTEILNANGYCTILAGGREFIHIIKSKSGYDIRRGFRKLIQAKDTTNDLQRYILYGEKMTDTVIDAINNNKGKRFFVWMHYSDIEHWFNIESLPFDLNGTPLMKYRKLLYYEDCQVGRLINALKEMGLYDKTIIVFTSDHGEALGENGIFNHGRFLFKALTHIPLAIRIPGQGEGASFTANIGLIDIMPSILSLCNIDNPKAPKLDGLNILPVKYRSDYLEKRLLILKEGYYKDLIYKKYKLHTSIKDATYSLYDIISDPLEKNPINILNPEIMREMYYYSVAAPAVSD